MNPTRLHPHYFKSRPRFPRYGNVLARFSTLWKLFFHSVENISSVRPPPAPALHALAWLWPAGAIVPRHGLAVAGPRRWNTFVGAALLVLWALPTAAQLGPWPIRTRQAILEASIYKREKDILWIERKTSDGSRAPQVGLAVADIVEIRMPRPALFTRVEKLLASPKPSAALMVKGQSALDAFIVQTKSLRDIPGIPANEAMLLKGQLLDRQNRWRESIRLYDDVLTHAPRTAAATNAQIRAGIAHAKNGNPFEAVEYLGGIPLPEDDEELLSELLFALGDSYFALGNYDNALLSYLPLVVFYPYVGNNEPRGLAAALTCYAELQEWEPLYRTIQEIQSTYPDTPAAKAADQILGKYKDELTAAGQMVDAAKITSHE